MRLYDDVHVVVDNLNSREKITNLRILVEHVDKCNGKIYSIRITDDADPTILYILLLGEEDFSALKIQQGLRVDFDNFSCQLAKLLDGCKDQTNQFLLLTNEDKGPGVYLKIIKRDDFNDICRLSLRLTPGNDRDIRDHLCLKLKHVEEELAKTTLDRDRVLQANEQCENALEERNRKIKELEMRLSEETNALRISQHQQVAEEREKHEKHLRELENTHQQQITSLRDSLDLLSLRNKSLEESKRELDKNSSILAMKLETSEKEKNRLSELYEQLEQTSQRLERDLASSQHRCAKLKEENHTLASQLTKACNDLGLLKVDNTKLAKTVDRLEKEVSRKSNILGELSQRNKLLEDEKFAINTKRGDLLKIIKLLESQKDANVQQLEEKNKRLIELNEENSRLKNELTEKREKLEELEKETAKYEIERKMKNDIITRLHREIEEKERDKTQKNTSAFVANRTLNSYISGKNLTSEMFSKNASKQTLDPSYLVPADSEIGISRRRPNDLPYFSSQ